MVQHAPITIADEDCELCYECDGARVCWSCHGVGTRANGSRCNTCVGRGLCLVCNGDGQLPAGTRAKLGRDDEPSSSRRIAKTIGGFRELGYDDGPALADVRGKRSSEHTAEVVAYLRGGKVLVMSPGLVEDTFDGKTLAGKRSMRTDGEYAWPDSLAYYVEQHQVALPAEFEQHMAARTWQLPADIDIKGLVPG